MPGGGASPAPAHVKDLGTTWAPAPKTVGLVAGQLAALLLPTFRHLRGPEARILPKQLQQRLHNGRASIFSISAVSC